MGLAASQARLLLLTSRQSDVENQLMTLANQKLSLSRKTADVSAQYQNALNATVLNWATDDGDVALTYDLLMRPNTVADDGQYLLTNASTGRIILDDSYISDLGIAQAGNAGDIANMTYTHDGVTYTGLKAFLMRLIGCNSDTADDYISKVDNTDSDSIFETAYSDTDIIAKAIGLGSYTAVTKLYEDTDKASWWGSAKSSVDTSAVVQDFDDLLKSYSSSMGSVLTDYLESYLGSDYQPFVEKALDYAYQATYNKFVYNINDTDSEDGIKLGEDTNFASGSADNKNTIAVKTTKKSGFLGFSSKSTTTVSVDNSQVADTFLTYFDQYCAQNFGGTNDSTVGSSTTTRAEQGGTGEQTDNNSLRSELQPGDLNVNNNDVNDAYEASFYINLYNALLASGWENKSNVSDSRYMQNEILYGNIAIKEMAIDGTWNNLASGDSQSPLSTARDEDAIQKAEAEYNTAKSTLSSLESSLDVKMNDLDSERTAITTEVESVKSILKKNIETSFKMFTA